MTEKTAVKEEPKTANGPAEVLPPLESTALARVESAGALEPATFEQAKSAAMIFAQARLVASAEIAVALIMRGRPLGLDAMTSVTKMFTVENGSTGLLQIGMYADLILALTRKHSAVDYIELLETTAEKCVMIGKRRSSKHETRIEWTIERAQRAELLDRGKDEKNKKLNNWNRYPENMLRARATSEICKIVCPEATMGIDAIEVLRDEARTVTVDIEGTVVQAPKPGRDYRREVDALKLEISGADTAATAPAMKARRELTEKIKSAELPGPYGDEVRAAYNARFHRGAADLTSTATTTPPAKGEGGKLPGVE